MGFKEWPAWLKGGLISEILLLLVSAYIVFTVPWGFMIIFLLIPLGIVVFIIGAFLGNLFSKRVNKSPEYHKKWMISSLFVVLVISITKFVSNLFTNWSRLFLPVEQTIGISHKWELIFNIDGMSPLFYMPLFTCVGIFIIATILFIILKIKSRKESDPLVPKQL